MHSPKTHRSPDSENGGKSAFYLVHWPRRTGACSLGTLHLGGVVFCETGTDALRVLEELVGAVCYAGSLSAAKTERGRGSAYEEVSERERR